MPDSITQEQISNLILEMVAERAPKTICPSEVARALASDWRSLMPQVRDVADALKLQGKVRILQRGREIDSAVNACGPIRLSI